MRRLNVNVDTSGGKSSDIQFILASATIGNPIECASKLINRPAKPSPCIEAETSSMGLGSSNNSSQPGTQSVNKTLSRFPPRTKDILSPLASTEKVRTILKSSFLQSAIHRNFNSYNLFVQVKEDEGDVRGYVGSKRVALQSQSERLCLYNQLILRYLQLQRQLLPGLNSDGALQCTSLFPLPSPLPSLFL